MRNFKKLLGVLLSTLLISFSFIGCGSTDDSTVGYIWVASKGDIKVNLIGTMHPAPSDYNFFNKDVNKILKKTDVLSVEADITDTDKIMNSQNLLINKSDEKLKDALSEDEITFLETLLKSTGFNRDGLNILTPAAIVSLVERSMYSNLDLSTSFDEQLIKKCQEKNIEINELESVEFQLNLLNELYTWQDVKNSIASFKDETQLKATNIYINATMTAYKEGDIEFLEADLLNMKTQMPDFYDGLVTKRNITMAKDIDALIQDGKNHTIAVGCKHFIGDDSILKELEKLGYTITKL